MSDQKRRIPPKPGSSTSGPPAKKEKLSEKPSDKPEKPSEKPSEKSSEKSSEVEKLPLEEYRAMRKTCREKMEQEFIKTRRMIYNDYKEYMIDDIEAYKRSVRSMIKDFDYKDIREELKLFIRQYERCVELVDERIADMKRIITIGIKGWHKTEGLMFMTMTKGVSHIREICFMGETVRGEIQWFMDVKNLETDTADKLRDCIDKLRLFLPDSKVMKKNGIIGTPRELTEADKAEIERLKACYKKDFELLDKETKDFRAGFDPILQDAKDYRDRMLSKNPAIARVIQSDFNGKL